MVSFFSIIALGFFLGMRHATDPDHVIAVTTIVSRQRNIARSALIGAFWGVGHTLTILLVGAGIILFNLVIPPRLGLSMELSVGLMLIVLGALNVLSFFRSLPGTRLETPEAPALVHSHAASTNSSENGDGDNVRADGHAQEAMTDRPSHTHHSLTYLDRLFGRLSMYQYARPLLVGIVHGLAGSAAVALLVLTTIRDSRWAVAYLLVFGIGTIAGMMLITVSIASTFNFVGRNRNWGQRFSRQLAVVSGLLSLAFGLVVVYQICIMNGLLTGHPSWTPR